MGDSQHPKPTPPRFDVPDLELAPAARRSGRVLPAPAAESSYAAAGDDGLYNRFGDEPSDGPSIDLADDHGSAAPDASAVDVLEVRRLAAYGDPPTNAYSTPGYAYRVFARRRELKSALAGLEAELARAERGAERAQALSARVELHRRAVDSFDRARAAQGVRLALTCAALFLFLIALKLAL